MTTFWRSRARDKALLYANQCGVAYFYTEIAARHHDGIGSVDDLVQGRLMAHDFGALDLGDQARIAAGGDQQAPRFDHVGGRARK